MIAIIGGGNVATHLYNGLKDKTDVQLVNSRTFEGMPEKPDIILLSVSDDAIPEVVKKLMDYLHHPSSFPESSPIVAHTSGSVSLSELTKLYPESGVFYPLQTFSKNSDLDYDEIPVFIEGNDEKVVAKLTELARLFSKDVRMADSVTRRQLHLASVFACNFTNALAGVAEDLLKDSGIEFSTLLPLMKQTIKKLEHQSPKEAQTGPAVRGDVKVIEKHLKMLENNPELHQLYSLFSNLISSQT